jgi:hypothetical protein
MSHAFPHTHCRSDRLQGKRPAASYPNRCYLTKPHITAKQLRVNQIVVVVTRVARDEGRRKRGAPSMVSLSILPMHGIDAYRE